MFNELGSALKVTVQVVSKGNFWVALVRALLSPPLLVVITVSLTLNFLVDARQLATLGVASGGGWGLLIVCVLSLVLLYPLLMRAWCPEVARAVLQAQQLDLPEQPLPSIGRFVGAWLLVALIGLLIMAPGIFIPRPYAYGLLLPAALLFSGYQVRCALCIHATARQTQAVVAATMGRRTLLWWPVCALPWYLCSAGKAALLGRFVSPFDITVSPMSRVIDLLGMAASFAAFALMLVIWAALSLQALGTATPASAPAPTAKPDLAKPAAARRTVRAPSGRAWLPALLVVLAVAGGAAYVQRLTLLHHYLGWTDADYKTDIGYWPQGQPVAPFLASVMEKSACANRAARVQTMFKAGFKPEPSTLGRALACAAANDNIVLVGVMLEHGADVNSAPQDVDPGHPQPVTALQHAVANHNGAMLTLLLEKGADAALLSSRGYGQKGPGALHFAARNRDAAMIRTLLNAGASPNAGGPDTPMAWYLDATAIAGEHTAAGWSAALAAAEAAGLNSGALDADGGNLLHWAATHGQFALIEALLARGMDRSKQEREGATPFVRLAAWYRASAIEPGDELETALTALSTGLPDINQPATFMQQTPDKQWHKEIRWTLASAAAVKPRLRALFAERIDYTMLGVRERGQDWPMDERDQAIALIAYFSKLPPAAAPTLPGALRAKGWADLATLAESMR